MESNGRRAGLYAAAGVLIAVLVIAGVFISGVQFPSIPSIKAQTGTLIVLLTDAPVNLTYLNLTIDSFSVHRVTQGWIPLQFDGGETNVTFNLLDLYDETMKLTNATIPTGNYTKMRMTIRNATATFKERNGEPRTENLTVPSGHIDIIIHFEIVSEETDIVLIDIQPDWAAISKSNRLRPVLKASVVE